MPGQKRTVRLRRRPRTQGGCCGCKRPKTRRRIKGGSLRVPINIRSLTRRKKNSDTFNRWANLRARPWMARGRGMKPKTKQFFKDFARGFKMGFKPLATIGGPILDALGMPEVGIPLSTVAGLM